MARLGLLTLCAACAAWWPALASATAPNDNFAAAAVLSGAPVTVSGTNVGATAEPGEPGHGGHGPYQSVWWSWTAPADGAFTIDTCGSDFDTLLAVYTGTGFGSLSLVKGNDDACDIESSVTFVATSGQVYWIAVDGFDDEGAIRLTVRPTLRVSPTTVVRRRKIDATRFSIEVAPSDEDDTPRLTLVRGSSRVNVDLDLENENEDDDGFSETSFTYTFDWLCARNGRWRWTVSVSRGGEQVSSEGTFAVPACRRQGWFVSHAKVAQDFGRDFGARAARELRCQPVGPRRGSLAHTWRCGLVQPGAVCVGSFLFRYARVLQGGEVVATERRPSGGVSCRR